jgi:hypothetical protein
MNTMLKLILSAAALTALPIVAAHQLCLPALPAPVQIFGKSGGVILLESVRLAALAPSQNHNA